MQDVPLQAGFTVLISTLCNVLLPTVTSSLLAPDILLDTQSWNNPSLLLPVRTANTFQPHTKKATSKKSSSDKMESLKSRIPRVCYNRKEKSRCTFPLILNLGNDPGHLHFPVASSGIKKAAGNHWDILETIQPGIEPRLLESIYSWCYKQHREIISSCNLGCLAGRIALYSMNSKQGAYTIRGPNVLPY